MVEVDPSPPPGDEHQVLQASNKDQTTSNAEKAQPSLQRQASCTSSRTSGAHATDPDEAPRNTVAEVENLVVLDEAVDDGTTVKTAGTLFFTLLQAFNLPETESHGGLLWHDRQDLYLSMSLQTGLGNEQEKSTSARQGESGTVAWDSETISITYTNEGDAVIAEASVWNENPGSDVIIGKAAVTARHVRALALLQNRCARIRLPLSRQRAGGRLEYRGVLVARVRLVLDIEVPRSTLALSAGHGNVLRNEIAAYGGGQDKKKVALSEDTPGCFVCSGITAYDLPPREGLEFGGCQTPYVRITLGSTSERSSSVAGGRKLYDWTHPPLRCRSDPRHLAKSMSGTGLVVEVWNDNQPRRDALMGSGLVRAEALRQVQQYPGEGGLSCRVKISRRGKGNKGTVGMVVSFEPDQPETSSISAAKMEASPQTRNFLQQRAEDPAKLLIKNIAAGDLSDILAFGYRASDKHELYVVARVGVTEQTTPGSSVASGTSTWADTILNLPHPDGTCSRAAPFLRLELWTWNPVQDDQVGFAEIELGQLWDSERGVGSSAVQVPLQVPLCLVDPDGDLYGDDITPPTLSCILELQRTNQDENGAGKVSSKTGAMKDNDATTPRDFITLPVIGPTEGPGVLKVMVLDATLYEDAEAPEVRIELLPGKRIATTRPLLEIGGDSSQIDQPETGLTGVWNQTLDMPCYGIDSDEFGGTVTLQADIVVAGVLAGQRVLGRGQVDVSAAIQTRERRTFILDISSHGRGAAPHTVGKLSVSVGFVGAWDEKSDDPSAHQQASGLPHSTNSFLNGPGLLRVFVVEARGLSGLKREQDPYVVIERKAADPTMVCQVKSFSSAVSTVVKGSHARWLESCDLRVSHAEAEFLRNQPEGGSISFTVALTDKDVRGGDELISSLEVSVTPESLAARESSVLWHRLFFQGRDRGFIRLGCCWIPADLEPINVCGSRPEERVEAGTLYLWLKEGRDLRNPSLTAPRVRGLPPTCEVELRPYAKVGRKKAREVLGCARLPETGSPDLDIGVLHKFLKMDYFPVDCSEDRDLAEMSPSFVVSVYTKVGEKKVVSGRAEILLASLCGYKNLNGEAVLRNPRHTPRADVSPDQKSTGRTHRPSSRRSDSQRGLAFDEAELSNCPVAAVDKAIPLLEDDPSLRARTHRGAGTARCAGTGGVMTLRALFVPDRLVDALGVRPAIKALSSAAEASLQLFTENHSVALPRAAVGYFGKESTDSQALAPDCTALPGALEVYLIRATDLEQIEKAVELVVQVKLLCSVGAEVHTSEIGRGRDTTVEWNHQFSMLVDDANLEMLELLILSEPDSQEHQKPVARCKIPLRRYAQNYYSSRALDIGQVAPERFKLTDHRGRGHRGHIIVSLNFLPEASGQAANQRRSLVVGQTHILREAFAPTNSPLFSPASTSSSQRLSSHEKEKANTSAIHILIVCMDGGDVSREDRVRVRASLAEDSDDWGCMGQPNDTTSTATSGVGEVDEEAATCRWDSPRSASSASAHQINTDGDTASLNTTSGELLSLTWDPRLPLAAWSRGRASVIKFEVSRGPGRPVEWTGFVPTAGLVHSPRSVFERAIRLTGRVGSEPPTSARTVASTGAAHERRGVSLEVAMTFHPHFFLGCGAGKRQADPKQSPFHTDLRRIACEAGELVVHCLRARNLRLRPQEDSGPRDLQPEVFLITLPDGGEAATSTSCTGPGGRHPVWSQTRTLSIADAATARVIVRVRNAAQAAGDNVLGEVELSMAGLVAAEHGMAAAVLPDESDAFDRYPSERVSDLSGNQSETSSAEWKGAGAAEKGENPRRLQHTELDGSEMHDSSRKAPNVTVQPDKVKPCGVEAWFPLFVPSQRGGSREREFAGEVRLSCRFLSTDFMLQRELTAGADEGDNGPVGVLRYALERRPGRLFLTIRCCRALPKAMIGERAPLVEARLRHGGWKGSTRRQAGLNPMFDETMAVEVQWTPQDFISPELILEVKDRALGGGLLAAVRVAVAPFILHPSMPAEIWCPLLPDGGEGSTGAGVYCGVVYLPSSSGKKNIDNGPSKKQSNGTSLAINSIENVVDPEFAAALRRAWNGMVHVQIISARGLPASSKDPQVGIRLRVADHCGRPLPPFQWTAAVRGGGGDPQFDSTFLLGLQQRIPGMDEESEGCSLGRTPVLEVETRCSRGRGKPLGTVHIPMFPLWFMGHMTRAWYPMRSSDGEAESGTVFIGLQFIADGKDEEAGDTPVGPANFGPGKVARRRYLFFEVRQGRDFRHVHTTSGDLAFCPAVHLELVGSGAKGKTPPARVGGADPQWPDGAGLLALPYPVRGGQSRGAGCSSEVLRITALNERGKDSNGQDAEVREGRGWTESSSHRVWVAGHCDWPLPTEDLASGRPTSSWHQLWVEGKPAGELHLRCRAGFEGEALDQPPPLELNQGKIEGSSPVSRLTFGNYHVEFMEVRGFDRTLRRMGLISEEPPTGPTQDSKRLPWAGMAYLAESPGFRGEDGAAYGAATARVASGRAVAVAARGRGGSRSLCVQVSIVGLSGDGGRTTRKTFKAVSCVQPQKLAPISEVPGTELLEWFPSVAVQDKKGRGRAEARDADTGQVLVSIRYAPLAVGILEVAVCEAQLTDSDQSRSVGPGNLKALSRLLPPQTGALMGHRVRSTPGRREVRTMIHDGPEDSSYDSRMSVSWNDACPHRMRFNNAFNNQPTSLHVVVVQGDLMVGFATVGVEAIVHDGMSRMTREICEGHRKRRGSAHDLGPVGCREEDFGGPTQAWYPLQAPPKDPSLSAEDAENDLLLSKHSPTVRAEVGRIRLKMKFAPHPKVLVRNWQEGAAVARADGIAAMKAIFYRLNRSGSMVIESEDLRLALVDAVDVFLTKSSTCTTTQRAASKAAGGAPRASHAGQFVLGMSEGIRSNLASGRGALVAESAADSVLAMIERDRTAEVTFTEFCMFLSQAAARQAETAVEDLVRELAEDNEDESGDDDSEDGVVIECDLEADGSSVFKGQNKRYSRPPAEPVMSSAVFVDRLPPREEGKDPATTSRSGGSEPPHDHKLPSTLLVEDGNFHAKEALPHPFPSPQSANDPTAAPTKPLTLTTKSMATKRHSRTTNDTDLHSGICQVPGDFSPTLKAKPGGTRPCETETLPADVTSWTVSQVLSWLSEDMQLPKYAHKFREASIDGLVLCDVTDDLLREGLSMSDPLHRLKILGHVQKLLRQHHRQHHQSYPPRKDRVQIHASAPGSKGLNGVKAASPRSDTARQREEDIPGELPPAAPSGEETPIRPMARSLQEHAVAAHIPTRDDEKSMATGFRAEGDRPLVGPQLDSRTDERDFVDAMNEVRGELVYLDRRGDQTTAGVPLTERSRRLPANATTGEVREVVQTAMWEAAALLEVNECTSTGRHGKDEDRDDFPPAWWGSSMGGSTDQSDSTDDHREVGDPSFHGSNVDGAEGSVHPRARLMFDKFCSFRQGTPRGVRAQGTSKLTRHRLEVGIRELLKIEMRWEQWQPFLDSVPCLRTQGHLSLKTFSKAFAFDALHPRETSATSPSDRGIQPETLDGSIDVEPNSLASDSQASVTTAKQEATELRGFVLGFADSLRTSKPTLESVICSCVKRGAKNISVSEFMSLIKTLTAKGAFGVKAGGFRKKQAYNLLRCVDRDGHRRVALYDLVTFVFATWTEELDRLVLRTAVPDEAVRQKRRQLQKDLRRNFPAPFRQALNLDAVRPETGKYGPFSGLLARLGLDSPTPPSPRSPPTFASPRRGGRHGRTNTARSSSQDDGARNASANEYSSPRDSVVNDARSGQRYGARGGRALSMSSPLQPSRADRPASSGGRGRLRVKIKEGQKELSRHGTFERQRVLSLPPRVDVSAVTLTAYHNRDLVAHGTFQTLPGGKDTSSVGRGWSQ
ncbi:unnamed protein product [Scytosiphon promiscuus]